MRLLALHGFLGAGDDWTAFLEAAAVALPDHRLHADTPDLPGHGATPADVPADFDGWVAWVRARLAAATEPVHLLGYSMGGRLALAAALAEAGERPDAIASLTLLGASPGLVDAGVRAERVAADAARADDLERRGLAAFLADWYDQPLFGPAVALLGRDALAARRAGGSAPMLAAALRSGGAGVMPDLSPRLPSLRAPLLVLAGEDDPRYVAVGRAIARAVPGGRAACIPDAGHSLLLEAPAECAALWSSFVTSHVNREGASP